jgi:hypothetical protein
VAGACVVGGRVVAAGSRDVRLGGWLPSPVTMGSWGDLFPFVGLGRALVARGHEVRLANSPAWELLRNASQELAEHVPGGYLIYGSGGRGTATHTPWVGVFDPDETTSPQRGIHVVYLFAEDLATVTLSIQQGITDLTNAISGAAARVRLALDATAIRERIGDAVAGSETTMRLASHGARQRGYEAANIAAVSYKTGALPPEATLRSDLNRILGLQDLAITAKREILVTAPGEVTSPSSVLASELDDPFRDFKPKDDSDYVSHLAGRTLVKSRRHERLVADYGRWAHARGWRPSTREYPIDLMLYGDGGPWMIEAKIVYHGNATQAVRATLGQLYEYRHFLQPDASMLALFSEPIDAFAAYLETYGIASVWPGHGAWHGSPTAREGRVSDT